MGHYNLGPPGNPIRAAILNGQGKGAWKKLRRIKRARARHAFRATLAKELAAQVIGEMPGRQRRRQWVREYLAKDPEMKNLRMRAVQSRMFQVSINRSNAEGPALSSG